MLWGVYAWRKKDEMRLYKIAVIIVISSCYGILIEVLQETCTTTRHADIFDVLANLSGATIALLIFVLIKKRKTLSN